MAKLGTEKNPAVFRVQTEERLMEIAAICQDNDWKFIGGLEPDQPEDISDVEYLLDPEAFGSEPRRGRSGQMPVVKSEPDIGRNDPCPCGSGKKYKKCCGR
jgi:SWIM/SEC-C metal-binding protein